jgi:hypothetical protein
MAQRVRGAVLGWLALLLTVPADARDDGHELLRQCGAAVRELDRQAGLEPEARLGAQYCFGFVAGITNVVSIAYHLKPDGQLFCPPDGGIAPRAAVRVLVEYLKSHPERLHARKVTLAAAAFMQAYPCLPPSATVPTDSSRANGVTPSDTNN